MSFLVYAATVAIFIVALLKCVVPVLTSRRLLRRAVREINAGEKSKRSWQDETFLGKGDMYPHWREYLNNLFFADGEFHNPSNVEDFINEETAIYGPGRSALAEAAPGLMVSLGFLGTLIGITMGLQNFSMESTEAVMNAIRTLIPGMRYAFITSIVGVVGSISFTLIMRYSDGAALNALNAFYVAMRQVAGVVSVDPMTQIAIYQQEQTALIQALSDDLSGEMAMRIGNVVDHAVKPLQKSLEDFVTMTTREQIRGMDAMVSRFIQQLDHTLDSQFQHLAYTIDLTCRNQQQMQEEIRKTIEGLTHLARDTVQVQKLTDNMLTQFDSYLGKLNTSHKMVDDGYSRIASNVEHLEIIARQQNSYLQNVGELQTEATKSLAAFQQVSGTFMEEFEKHISVTVGSLTKISDEMKKSGESLAKYQKLFVEGVDNDVDKMQAMFRQNMEALYNNSNAMLDDIKYAIHRLPDLLNNTSSMYEEQANRMTDALRRAEVALEEAIGRLNYPDYGR